MLRVELVYTHTLARFAQTGTRHKEKVEWWFYSHYTKVEPPEPLCSLPWCIAAGTGQHFSTANGKKASQSICMFTRYLLTRVAVMSQALSSDWIRRVFDITAATVIGQSMYSENEH